MNLAATARRSKSQKIREKLDYPVIDADGHMLEVEPVLLDFLKVVGGPRIVQRYIDMLSGGSLWGWYKATPEERAAARIKRAPFWFFPAANTLDRATSMFPGLMRARLDEFGIDFSFIYPTLAILFAGMDDEEMRKAVTRAINTMNAELYAPHRDRLTPAAVIPMHTPQEALDELNFAVGTLGMKAAMVEGVVRRPIKGRAGTRDMASAQGSYWIDPLALDSPHDYDPVWRRFVELGVAPTMHTSTMGWVDRTSISNVTYNHIGHFAAGAHAFCKALVLGGVTHRFPTLNFGFLECGVGWAASLYNDLIEHWEKRNVPALKRNLDPARIDRQLLVEMAKQHGGPHMQKHLPAIARDDGYFYEWPAETDEAAMDDFAAAGIQNEHDIYNRFVRNFYFGCESDDRILAWAFNERLNQFGAQFKVLLGSDIGHMDVTDARQVIKTAWSLVDEGSLTDANFRDLVFTNPVEMHGGMNPALFKGTAVEDAAGTLLASLRERDRATAK